MGEIRFVDLRPFHLRTGVDPGRLPGGAAGERLAPLVEQLRLALLRAARTDETIRVGRLLQSDSQAERGIYLRRGWWVGASIGLRWVPSHPLRCELRVNPLSAAAAWAVWIALAAGMLLAPAFVFGIQGGRFLADPELRLYAGLALGTALSVALGAVLVRSSALIDMPASRELTARVQQQVDAMLDAQR